MATKAISVRIDLELAEVLTEEAARESRSVTGQLEYILRRAFQPQIERRRAEAGADDADDEAVRHG